VLSVFTASNCTEITGENFGLLVHLLSDPLTELPPMFFGLGDIKVFEHTPSSTFINLNNTKCSGKNTTVRTISTNFVTRFIPLIDDAFALIPGSGDIKVFKYIPSVMHIGLDDTNCTGISNLLSIYFKMYT
jgi:hypothetical protein